MNGSSTSQPCEINSAQGNQLTTLKPSQTLSNNMDDLKSISVKRPSFPPSIDTEYLVENLLKRKSKSPKMPNEFFIYRAALVKELKANNYKIKMTKLSTLAANSWSQEPPNVKSVYRRLARETEKQYLNVRKQEMSNSMKSSNNLHVTRDPVQKKKISRVPSTTPTPTSTPKPIHSFESSIDEPNPSVPALPEIGDIVNVTMSPLSPLSTISDDVNLAYQQYPSICWQPPVDFKLMEDNSIFGMRPGYNHDTLYLTPSQQEYPSQQDYLDNLSISTFSSENSSPASNYLPSPLLPSIIPLNSTNTNKLNGNPQESNCFFAPLSTPIYGLGEYQMTFEDALVINDFSHNYPQFYEQTINNTFEQNH